MGPCNRSGFIFNIPPVAANGLCANITCNGAMDISCLANTGFKTWNIHTLWFKPYRSDHNIRYGIRLIISKKRGDDLESISLQIFKVQVF